MISCGMYVLTMRCEWLFINSPGNSLKGLAVYKAQEDDGILGSLEADQNRTCTGNHFL